MSTIKLEFTLEEINGLLNTLAQLPFIQSVGLINVIQNQAAPQIALLKKEEEPKDESTPAS